MFHFILQRISSIPMLPELRAALEQIVEQDWQRGFFATQDDAGLVSSLEFIFQSLSNGDDIRHAQPFLLGWHTLRSTILRLDHIQDDDPEDIHSFNRTLSKSQQYNLVLACYVLAMSMLDDLDEQFIPASRIRRVVRIWNDALLRAASGQQRDLAQSCSGTSPSALLEYYDEAMRAKAGSIYNLGFGGIAVLATDDQQAIGALCLIGEIYGTLLQLSDDIYDASRQDVSALTLAQVYKKAVTSTGLTLPDHSIHLYGQRIYYSYLEQIRRIVSILPHDLQSMLLDLFRRSFPLLSGSSSHD